MISKERLLNRKAASQLCDDRGIPFAVSTLAKLASVGGGPPMRKFGRRVLYEPEALSAWIDSKLTAPRQSTSDIDGDFPVRVVRIACSES